MVFAKNEMRQKYSRDCVMKYPQLIVVLVYSNLHLYHVLSPFSSVGRAHDF